MVVSGSSSGGGGWRKWSCVEVGVREKGINIFLRKKLKANRSCCCPPTESASRPQRGPNFLRNSQTSHKTDHELV